MLVYPEKHSRHVTLAQETMRWGLMIIRVILTSYELWDNFQTRAEFEARCWAHVNVSTHVDYLHMRIRLEKMCSTDSLECLPF